jgi:hypothetical protein
MHNSERACICLDLKLARLHVSARMSFRMALPFHAVDCSFCIRLGLQLVRLDFSVRMLWRVFPHTAVSRVFFIACPRALRILPRALLWIMRPRAVLVVCRLSWGHLLLCVRLLFAALGCRVRGRCSLAPQNSLAEGGLLQLCAECLAPSCGRARKERGR